MGYALEATRAFLRSAKKLKRRYPSLDRDLAHLRGQLIQNPRTGAPLAHDCFEIRLKIGSKGKGKSGGARVITAVVYAAEKVYLLDIYDKGDRATVTDKQAAY